MLVLSRRDGERILIGDSITVTVTRIGENTVKLGIDAPRDVPVIRAELKDRHPEPNPATVSTAVTVSP